MSDWMSKNVEFYNRAKELVSKMTMEEVCTQLSYESPEIKRLNVPSYNWWNEALHGVARAGSATSFPQAINLAAMFDANLIERIGDVIATEGRAKYNESVKENDRDIYKGLTFWAPNVNIFRDPRWGRGHETYGEDPYLSSELGKAFVRGVQGDKSIMKAAACAKHFAVHSGPEDLRHEFDARPTPKDLMETYLPAFEACVREANVEGVMGAYNSLNGIPCCGNQWLIQELLRETWEFKGYYVSDCWAIRDFHTHHMVTATAEESAAMALNAGCDLNCGNTYLHVYSAYINGRISKEVIQESATRLFATRFKLGLFDESEFDEIKYETVCCREHRELALDAARRSIVMLKNDGILPLNSTIKKTIGVIGPNADSRLALIGNYYGTSPYHTTILEGIQKHIEDETDGSIRVLYAKGSHLFREMEEPLAKKEDRLAEAVSVAKHSDVVVLCLGLDETLEGEEQDEGNHYGSGDKKDLSLPDTQIRLMEQILQLGKPVILVLLAGSAIDISLAKEQASAILFAGYPGAQGGEAVADIMFGKVSPSGKLPITFYEGLDLLPEFTDYSMKNRTYKNYPGKPLYSFGYGLSFANISIVNASLKTTSKVSIRDLTFGGFEVSVTVSNQSKMVAEEVIQIYRKSLCSEYAPCNYALVAFERVKLTDKEEKTITLRVLKNQLYDYDEMGNKILTIGENRLYVGTNPPNLEGNSMLSVEPISLSYSVIE